VTDHNTDRQQREANERKPENGGENANKINKSKTKRRITKITPKTEMKETVTIKSNSGKKKHRERGKRKEASGNENKERKALLGMPAALFETLPDISEILPLH
jgi:hypothetical protein